METGSYLLAGTEHAMHETFGSTMHGSGRTMSRAQAKKTVSGEQIRKQMEQRGIIVKAVSMSRLAGGSRSGLQEYFRRGRDCGVGRHHEEGGGVKANREYQRITMRQSPFSLSIKVDSPSSR